MGCCCSTSRWACPATRPCRNAKWLLRADKAGHTGTLDPLATGVLPLCFGAATKFSQLHLDADKTYEAPPCCWE
jgi:tRNA U55 pseudouridine synthase TruB